MNEEQVYQISKTHVCKRCGAATEDEATRVVTYGPTISLTDWERYRCSNQRCENRLPLSTDWFRAV